MSFACRHLLKLFPGLACLLFLVVLSVPAWTRAWGQAEKGLEPEAAQPRITYEEWAKDADLAITLDQHMYPALLNEIKEYAQRHKLKIVVREGTCGISGGALSNKTVDMAGFCCPPSQLDKTGEVDFHTIAIGAIAMYVHPDNPISNLSLDEAREVFAGNITRWSELKTEAGKPGPAYSIQPIGRLHCKNRPGHWRLLLDNEDLFSPRLIEVGTIEDVFRQVEGNPYSIGGFESLYMAGEVYPAGKHLKTVKINGYAPTPGNLLSGNYPLYFVFNITTWKKTGSQKAMDADLIAYLQQKISEVDAKFGMVPSDKLRQAGWQFSGDELVGAPLPVKGER